jgi:hypothetical protein
MPYNPADLVDVDVTPALTGRNKVTSFFRVILAIPHILLVGGPMAFVGSWVVGSGDHARVEWGAGTGVLGAVASVVAFIAWFAILFTGRIPDGLWNLAALYLRWRVRANAYLTLLRDEYPPFGDEPYPAELILPRPTEPRNKLTVAFRLFLAIPQFIAVGFLGLAWGITTIIAWFSILFTGNYPPGLYDFGVGVLRWSTRVEAYVLLLRDEYPPFSLG